MCGIVGAVAERDIVGILIEGLHRLEYRGYDSSGIALIDASGALNVMKRVGKVSELDSAVSESGLRAHCGAAHTRWATHGRAIEQNAHPHVSGDIAVVHNGIIENHLELRKELEELAPGRYEFLSETDSEIIVHYINELYQQCGSVFEATRQVSAKLRGSYAIAVTCKHEPGRVFGARFYSPLVIGIGIGETYMASDSLALRPVTDRFVYLNDRDLAIIENDGYQIFDADGKPVEREVKRLETDGGRQGKGSYAHYMQKEIFEQPEVVAATLRSLIGGGNSVMVEGFGIGSSEIFDQVKAIHIVACGTSYYAGLIASYWLESIAGIACRVEFGSEYRYRQTVIAPNTMLVCVSQSGETADTLAAVRHERAGEYLASLAICNVADSSLVRESDLHLITEAGWEIGVASTKAFVAQLVALLMLTAALGRISGRIAPAEESELIDTLRMLPSQMRKFLDMDGEIKQLARHFADKHNALFLGRGIHYPVAMEGALKMKEISYIHAEAYPSGELKHGPLALVDFNLPVIAVAPNDSLREKLYSSLHEVRARGGQLVLFSATPSAFSEQPGVVEVVMPPSSELTAPIAHIIPLQLLAYHTAVIKGTDVDHPRNLAKSVTVE